MPASNNSAIPPCQSHFTQTGVTPERAGALLEHAVGELVEGFGVAEVGLAVGLGGQQDRGPHGLQVQDGPQAGRDVQRVQAQVVRFPARAERGGQVAVAGPVNLLDPGAQAGDGFGSSVGREVPPLWRRFGVVGVGVGVVEGGGGELGEGGCVLVQVRLSRVSCSWWAASWSRIAAIGSLLVMVSSRGSCRRPGRRVGDGE